MSDAARLVAALREHVRDERVLAAVEAVPRDRFVPEELRARAWENVPLPIGGGQTISQPLVVARMCELLALDGSERVLDVGTGSGYHAAVLARLARRVWSVELRPELARQAATTLAALGVANAEVFVGDGRLGVPQASPFDAINVAAAAPDGQVPAELEAQLAPGGRLVAPVDGEEQHLVRVWRDRDDVLHRERLERVKFVPLV